jgi:hypothetical protein
MKSKTAKGKGFRLGPVRKLLHRVKFKEIEITDEKVKSG